MQENIEVGFQTFVSDGGDEFGAVRAVAITFPECTDSTASSGTVKSSAFST